jgi:hypothetical protein
VEADFSRVLEQQECGTVANRNAIATIFCGVFNITLLLLPVADMLLLHVLRLPVSECTIFRSDLFFDIATGFKA